MRGGKEEGRKEEGRKKEGKKEEPEGTKTLFVCNKLLLLKCLIKFVRLLMLLMFLSNVMLLSACSTIL